MSADLLRNLTLAVPVLAVALVLVLRAYGVLPRRTGDHATAALATLLAWVGVLAVEQATELWRFAPSPTSFLGMPLETSVGWALAWGALPALVGGHPVLWWAALAWVDLLVLPRLEPLVALGPRWLLGEIALLVLVLAPTLLLVRATRHRRWLPARVALQGATFTGVVLWLVPEVAFARDGATWADVVDHSLAGRTALLVAAVAFAVPALAAVAEVARVGGGTPWPWDPPDRLVTTGPYAYVANPMQLGASCLMALLALAAGSWWLGLACLVAVVFSTAVAEPHERRALARRWPEYATWRDDVHAWLPSWRPRPVPATLWFSEECGTCRAAGGGIATLRPRGLTFRAAEDAGVRLTRMRWVGPTTDRGVAALARALEQVCLPLAWLGWLVRLPGVVTAVQVVTDTCGLGPRVVDGRTSTREDVAA